MRKMRARMADQRCEPRSGQNRLPFMCGAGACAPYMTTWHTLGKGRAPAWAALHLARHRPGIDVGRRATRLIRPPVGHFSSGARLLSPGAARV
jgi:hypothetical protein